MAYRLFPPDTLPPGGDTAAEVHDSGSSAEICSVTSTSATAMDRELRQSLLFHYKLHIVQTIVMKLYTEGSRREYLIALSQKQHKLEDGSTYQFSVKTMERWVRDYQKSGNDPKSLEVKVRKDKGESRKLSPAVVEAIQEKLQQAPAAKATDILDNLVEEHVLTEGAVCVETVRRLIRLNGWRVKVASGEYIRHSFIYQEIGQMWEADTCYFLKIWVNSSDKWVYVQGIMDNHSRVIVSARCYLEDNAANFRKTLMDAILHHHIPALLYVDNGGPYIDQLLIETCKRLGIALVHTRSNDGAAKGAIERWWETLETKTLLDIAKKNPRTVDEVQQLVDKWVGKYHNTVNTGVGGKPWDRYMASLHRQTPRKALSREWLYDFFLKEVNPIVHKDTVVHVACTRFRVPDELAKEKRLIVRYDPDNPKGTIYALYNDKKYYLKEDDKEANAHEKRNRGGRTAELRERAEAKKKAKEAAENPDVESTMTPEARELLEQSRKALLEEGETESEPKTLEEARAEERYNRRMARTSILKEEDAQSASSASELKLDLTIL